MIAFARTDTSVLARWWWTVDRVTIAALMLLILIGAILTLAASPTVAERVGLPPYHFVMRQAVFLVPAIVAMVGVSLMPPLWVRRAAVVAFLFFLLLLALTLVAGSEIKGARRWIDIAGFSVQPSEFIRPTFAVVAAWLFAEHRTNPGFPGNHLSMALCAVVVGLLVLQPDFGMTLMVVAVWGIEFFMAGLPWVWVILLALLAVGGAAGGYFLLPHVAARVDRFLDPASGDSYQVTTSINAIQNGGLIGRGPGEGVIKAVLPDAHTDFIFAVAGEEFGVLACVVIVGLFALVVLRGLSRVMEERNLFVLLAVTGLLANFGLQAFVNMGVAVSLVPTTGMTLPFISYGGSSLLATALGMGMVLALTRRRLSSEVI